LLQIELNPYILLPDSIHFNPQIFWRLNTFRYWKHICIWIIPPSEIYWKVK